MQQLGGHSHKGAAAMERLSYLPTLLLIFASSPAILASRQLQIPLEIEETNEQLENDINSLFVIINEAKDILGCYSFIAYTGNVHLRPSLEQRLTERFEVPIYTVASNKGPANHRYKKAEHMVIILFSGLNDPTLDALNDTELSSGSNLYHFLYVPQNNEKRPLTKDEIWRFFTWYSELNFDRVLLFFHGESEFEVWTYFYFANLTVSRITEKQGFNSLLRNQGFRFSVQVANDSPTIFWYNSTEQKDVTGGGNVSISGPIGILMVEFMRYINATMDIIPIAEAQNSNYEVLPAPTGQRVDMVANLVINDSLFFSPVVADTQLCLLISRRRKIPPSRYFVKMIDHTVHLLTLIIALLVFAIKYFSQRRRSLVDSFFSTIRFNLGMPLPAGQLERLPLADRIIEVYSLLFIAIFYSACASILSCVLTAGLYYPPITNVESMRASGLRIITEDPTIKQAFRDNRMPRSLADLVDVLDLQTVIKNFEDLNDNVVFVSRWPNLWSLRMYQERQKTKRLEIAGPELCSNVRHLRLPISPKSQLRFTFNDYYYRIFESGLEQKWIRMSFNKVRQVSGINKMHTGKDNEWEPLTLSYYAVFIVVYVGGVLLGTLVFLIEVLYKRYRG